MTVLNILRTHPREAALTTNLNAQVVFEYTQDRQNHRFDLMFSMNTYEKIASQKENKNVGDFILAPINQFYDHLDHHDQLAIFGLYQYAKDIIGKMAIDNRHNAQDSLQDRIFTLIRDLNLDEKMIAFCRTSRFSYPDLSDVGKEAHHTKEKTFFLEDYIEITAVSLLSKMMVPIWGEFIRKLDIIGISSRQREKIAFELVEPTLEDSAFTRIYEKLMVFKLSPLVVEIRKAADKKGMSNATASYVLTHNGFDDHMFDIVVMAAIVVKRMATYECFISSNNANIPNAIVYIDDGIKRTADNGIKNMRNSMNTMPRRELSTHDDNQSILDHASKTSKKSIDIPVYVPIAAEEWTLPQLVAQLDTPIDVFQSAIAYYRDNPFDPSPLTQAMVASFAGTLFGGSKCLGYLPPYLYQQLVILLQIFLIRNELLDLAALVSSRSSVLPLEGADNPIALRMQTSLKSTEYNRCLNLFNGYLEKPVYQIGKRNGRGRPEPDKIDFTNHIERMKDWLVRYAHHENMAPALWDFAQVENRPIIGSECHFDEYVIRNLCQFYLLFHSGQRPF